jgi:hypothetical protein
LSTIILLEVDNQAYLWYYPQPFISILEDVTIISIKKGNPCLIKEYYP